MVEETDTGTATNGAATENIGAKPDRTRTRARKLHTLSGAVALGVFLIEHLLTNASALGGEASFENVVGSIEKIQILWVVELLFIFVPLAFHVGYGLTLIRQKEKDTPDADIARYGGDRRLWVAQRITGVIVLVFVLVHLWEFRVQRLAFGLRASGLYTAMTAHLSSTWLGVPWLGFFYVIGIGATAFHFSNGLFAATEAWGLWKNRRLARITSSTIGVLLFLIGGATVMSLATGTLLLSSPQGANSAPCGTISPAPAPSR